MACTSSSFFKRRAMVCALGLVWSTGCATCGGDDEPAQGVDAAPDMVIEGASITMQEAITALLDIQVRHACMQTSRCPAASYSDLPFLSRHPDRQSCEATEHNIVFDFLKLRYARLARQVDAQNMRYDGVQANLCVTRAMETFDETLCKTAVLQDASCSAMFTGLLTPGASCVEQDECKKGTTCEETLSLISCTGQCTACGVEICDGEATYCRRADGSSACAPTVELGEPCDEDDACGDTRQRGCLEEARQTQGVCVELGSRVQGEACSDEDHCARGLTCRNAMCDQVVLSDVAEPCSLIDVNTGLCKPGLVCTQTAPGEPSLCTPPRRLDEPCTSLLQCEAGLQCEEATPGDSRTGTCKGLRADDERCELPFECLSKRCIVLAPTRGVCASEVVCE